MQPCWTGPHLQFCQHALHHKALNALPPEGIPGRCLSKDVARQGSQLCAVCLHSLLEAVELALQAAQVSGCMVVTEPGMVQAPLCPLKTALCGQMVLSAQ